MEATGSEHLNEYASKPYYISWNAANLADNRNIGTTTYILFIISIIISV